MDWGLSPAPWWTLGWWQQIVPGPSHQQDRKWEADPGCIVHALQGLGMVWGGPAHQARHRKRWELRAAELASDLLCHFLAV